MGEKNRITDKQMKEKTCEVIDGLNSAAKNAFIEMFEICVQRTKDVLSDAFDNLSNKVKKKIKEKSNGVTKDSG